MTTWVQRKTGNDNNGGTSANVLATGVDGVLSLGNNLLTSASAPFTPAMVGHVFNAVGQGRRIITAYNSATSVTYGGTPISTHSGTTFNVGGAYQTFAISLAAGVGLMVAGDSLYIGAGVYREAVTVGYSGSAGLPILVIGDVDGAVTGDAGEVQITNYLVDDKHPAAASVTLTVGTNTNLTFSFLTIIGGQGGFQAVVSSAGTQNISFTDCALITAVGTVVLVASSSTGLPLNWTFDRCVFINFRGNIVLAISLASTSSGTGDWDANVVIRNCFIMSSSSSISITGTGSLAHKGGGVRVTGCMLWSGAAATYIVTATSVTVPCEAHGNLIFAGASTGLSAPILGQIVEDHNYIAASTPRNNVAIGPASVSDLSYAPLFDVGQAFKVSGIARPFLSPSSPTSPLLAFGQFMQSTGGAPSTFLAPSLVPPGSPGWQPPGLTLRGQEQVGSPAQSSKYDWANRPRPSGTRSNLSTVGYLEYHDGATQDTVTYDAGPKSAKLVGPGDIDLLIPVDAVTQTISIRCLYDTLYPVNNLLPTLTVLANGEIGVTAQTVSVAAGAPGTWQTITAAAITPTATGIIKIRLTSFDGSGTSQVNFDTLSVV